ncbi:MAG: hypothetical protein IT463_09040 [Planctomycetes bacterium]|nr:hypothetical protein [Planctomycetota bacterium]
MSGANRTDPLREPAIAMVEAWLLHSEGVAAEGSKSGASDNRRERDLWALIYAHLVGDEKFSFAASSDVQKREAEIAALLRRHAKKD